MLFTVTEWIKLKKSTEEPIVYDKESHTLSATLACTHEHDRLVDEVQPGIPVQI